MPKKDVILVLPYLGFHSDAITRRLKSCVYKFYCFVNLRVVFQNTHRIKSFFPYKDRFNHVLFHAPLTPLPAGIDMISYQDLELSFLLVIHRLVEFVVKKKERRSQPGHSLITKRILTTNEAFFK